MKLTLRSRAAMRSAKLICHGPLCIGAQESVATDPRPPRRSFPRQPAVARVFARLGLALSQSFVSSLCPSVVVVALRSRPQRVACHSPWRAPLPPYRKTAEEHRGAFRRSEERDGEGII